MKKRKIIALGIFALVFMLVISTFFLYPPPKVLKEETIMGAHRGNSVDYIENTIPAFRDALRKDKYKFIEFDVQYTLDKVLVVHHDTSLRRLQGKWEDIEDLTYADLLRVSDYRIPTYEEVMNLTAGEKPLNIEIKSQGAPYEDRRLADFLVYDLEKRGILNETLISSISYDVVQYINNRYNNHTEHLVYYSDYWIKNRRRVNTGLIYWVDESTFTKQVPGINFIAEFLRASGITDSITTDMYLSGANYLMLHGANIQQYNNIKGKIPFNTHVVLWTFDDQMYIVLSDKNLPQWQWVKDFKGDEVTTVAPWWETSETIPREILSPEDT